MPSVNLCEQKTQNFLLFYNIFQNIIMLRYILYYRAGKRYIRPRGKAMGYTKNIAVLKGVAGGFSVDGGPLSGLVKAERYSSELRAEVSLINFAPLSEGRYVAVLSDGIHCQIVENGLFEGPSETDTSGGFAAAVCYVNGVVRLLATAACGNCSVAAEKLRERIEREEKITGKSEGGKEAKAAPVKDYNDEAIAAENYYEYNKTDEGGEPVCESEKKEEDGAEPCKNEESPQPCEEGNFYQRMKEEIERVLASYPPVNELCEKIEGSRWVEIDYGGGAYYVFGVIYSGGNPKYLCYGIPSSSKDTPPAGMQGISDFLEVKTQHGMGFWVMYQSAESGKQLKPPAGE